MRASDLRLVELLDFSPEDGRIGFRDHRMLLWNADAFGNLRKELFEALGIGAARGMSHESAHDSARCTLRTGASVERTATSITIWNVGHPSWNAL